MLLSLILLCVCLSALITFWQPQGFFSALVTWLSGSVVILIATFSHHPWAHLLAAIGWSGLALMALSGVLTLALIVLWPQHVVRKRERLSTQLRLGVGVWLLLGGGWAGALITGNFNDSLWPWLTFIPLFSLYLAGLYATSLVGFSRAKLYPLRHADTLVVLGAGLTRGNQIGRVLSSRLNTALSFAARQTHPVKILVSGGQGPDETVSEATAMARYLRAHDFPTEQIIEEATATNTLTNLLNSQRLLTTLPHQGGRVVIVTSSYHLFRTQLIARHLGLHLKGIGAPTPWSTLVIAWAREFLAIIMLHPRLHRGVLLMLIVINGLWLLI